MTELEFKHGSYKELDATITNEEFDELSLIHCGLIEHDYFGQEYDIMELTFVTEGEKPADVRLLKGEAEKLRDYLNIALEQMEGNK